jgi:hypothetical protein
MTEEASSAAVPLLAVVRGMPTPDELAALMVVLASRATNPSSAGGARQSSWSAKSRRLRAPVRPGPGAWRASALPR